MNDIIVLGIIIAILGAAVGYIIWKKKKGAKCVGCSSAGNCDNSWNK